MLTIDMLPAAQGDCLWIEYGEKDEVHRILIDGGVPGTYKGSLRDRIAALPEEQRTFELLVVTHIDSDHIGGALELVRDAELGVTYGDLWFNGREHAVNPDELGTKQAGLLAQAIVAQKLPWNTALERKAVVVPDEGDLPVFVLAGNLTLTLLSPTKAKLAALGAAWEEVTTEAGLVADTAPKQGKAEPAEEGEPDALGDEINVTALAKAKFLGDRAPANGSSIALLLEYKGKKLLLAADAHAQVLVASIRRLLGDGEAKLHVDAFKLPHHGSRNNVSTELIKAVDTRRYLFSTSGVQFGHPDQQAVARVLQHGGEQPTLCFNYRSEFNEAWADEALQEAHHYAVKYPEPGTEGLRIKL